MTYCRVGVDLGVTSEHVACIDGGEGGSSHKTVKVSLIQEDLDKLCAIAKEKSGKESVHFICEATGMSWYLLALYAKKMRHSISRIKSHSMSTLRKFSKRKRKSDRLDAQTLVKAPLIDKDSLQGIKLPDALVLALKRACRQKDKFTEECSRVKNRILSFCQWVMPGIKECFDDPFSDLARSFFWHFTDPFKAKRAGIKGVRERLMKDTGKRIDNSFLDRIYQKVLQNCKFFEETEEYLSFKDLAEEMRLNLQHLKLMQKLEKKAEKKVEVLYKKVHPEKLIESLPGVGKTIGPALLGEIENVDRLPSQANFRSLIGIVPKQDDSGQRRKKGLQMSRDGSSRFRYLYYLAADTARQWDPQLAKTYYQAMLSKGKSHKEALVPVMAALANRTVAVLKRGTPYQLRDPEGNPVSKKEARFLIKSFYRVPEEVRRRTRSRRSQRKMERRSSQFRKRQPKAPQNWLENASPEERILFLQELVKSVSPLIKISISGGENKEYNQIFKEQIT